MGMFAKLPALPVRGRSAAAALAAVVLCAALLQACSSADPQLRNEPAGQRAAASRSAYPSGSGAALGLPQYDTVGLASWYGKPYHGRRTASGERYNMNQMTAAHPTLPFGTRVVVTNLENGRSVVVTINDRGPFKSHRIIDVSRKAAGQLGFLNQGLTRVGLRVLASSQG